MTFTTDEMVELLDARAKALGVKTVTLAMIKAAETVSQQRGWDYNTVLFAEFDRILLPPPPEPLPPPPPLTPAELTAAVVSLSSRIGALEGRAGVRPVPTPPAAPVPTPAHVPFPAPARVSSPTSALDRVNAARASAAAARKK